MVSAESLRVLLCFFMPGAASRGMPAQAAEFTRAGCHAIAVTRYWHAQLPSQLYAWAVDSRTKPPADRSQCAVIAIEDANGVTRETEWTLRGSLHAPRVCNLGASGARRAAAVERAANCAQAQSSAQLGAAISRRVSTRRYGL